MPIALRLLIPLVAGILFAYFYDLTLSWWIVVTCATLCWITYFLFRNRISVFDGITGIGFSVLFFVLGIYLESNADSQRDQTYFSHHTTADSIQFFQLRLVDYPQSSNNWIKFRAEVIAVDDKAVSGTTQIYIARDSLSEKLVYGDLLFASCRFSAINPPANPYEFDYRNYLQHQDIYHQAFIRSDQWRRFGNDANSLLQIVYQTRTACSAIIDSSGMKPENCAVAKALLLGDKEMISDELMLSYAASGTLHVLAVSGLHVGIVMLILSFVLSPLKRLKKGKILFLIFALIGIWFYTLLTGFSPSILRAAVMFSFVLIGTEMQRDTAIYQSLLVSALILILFDPHIIFNLGFLLSYLAVFGIVFFHPKIYAWYCPKYKITDKIWQLASVSIAAQLATLPLSLYCFYQFPTYFLLANLVVIPISFVILVMGIAALILASIPYIGEFLFYVMDLLITIMNEGVALVEELPAGVLHNLIIRWYDVLFMFALLFSFTFWLTKRSKKWLLVSLTCCTLICLSLLQQKLMRTETNLAVFYHVKHAVIVDIMHGSQITCFANAEVTTDEQKMRFHVYPNRVQNCGSSTASVMNLTDSTGVISIASKRILFLNQFKAENVYANQFPVIDLVYIHNATFLEAQLIQAMATQKSFVILGPDLKFSLKRFLKKRIDPNLIYDLTENGAAVIKLNNLPG